MSSSYQFGAVGHGLLVIPVGLGVRCRGCCRLCVGRGERFRIRLVEHGLDDLLLVGVQDLGQAFVQLRLFLLEVCASQLADRNRIPSKRLLMKTCLNMPYGSILSNGVSSKLSSSIPSSSSSAKDPNFWA